MRKIEEELLKASLYELSLLVGNKPIREYNHEGNVFVEGRNGSEYKIRIRNDSGTRSCFIVSVDGLSVLNGKQCANDSPGYILGPWETLDIACYKVDDATGAKFVFGSKDNSYSAAIGQGTDNVGVIGVMVFREVYKPIHVYRPPPFRPRYGWYDDNGYIEVRKASTKGIMRGASSSIGMKSAASAPMYSANSGSMSSTNTNSTLADRIGMIQTSANASFGAQIPPPTEEQQAEVEKLGTVFGGSMEWKTETVSFQREAAPAASLAIYYDTRKNLERRGVKLEQKVPALPNAFPGNPGCPVPDNWQK